MRNHMIPRILNYFYNIFYYIVPFVSWINKIYIYIDLYIYIIFFFKKNTLYYNLDKKEKKENI